MEAKSKSRWGIRQCMKSCMQLIRKSFCSLLLFEVVYKIAATYVVLPLSLWLISTSLKLWGTSYVSTENVLQAVMNPLLIISVIIVFLMLTMYTMFEISFLTLSYNQSYNDKQLGFLRMLKIAGQDAIRVLKPKNYLLVLFLLIIIPVSNSAMVSSLIGGIEIPNYIMEVVFDNPLYLTGVALLFTAMIVLIFRYLFVFHVYTLEDKSVVNSAKEAVRILKKKRVKSVFIFVVCQLICSLLYFAVWQLAVTGLSAVSRIFADNASLYSVLLVANTFLDKILSFAMSTLSVLTGYGIISGMFFEFRKENGEELPAAVEPLTDSRRKENFRIASVVLTVCFLSVLGMTYMNVSANSGISGDGVQIMAHRGACTDVPENTLPAFERAIELQADYIELDVQETKDGEIVVTHDSNFIRCTGYDGNVWEMTYDEISKLNAGIKFPAQTPTPIPRLRDVMELCKGKIKMNIELKSNGHEKHLEQSVAELINEYDMASDVVITSLTRACLVKMKEVMPDMPCGYIVSMAIGNYYDMSCSDFFSIEESFINETTVREAHKRGKTINAWTIDSHADTDKMINLGVDSIITNDPVMARESILGAQNPATRLSYVFN